MTASPPGSTGSDSDSSDNTRHGTSRRSRSGGSRGSSRGSSRSRSSRSGSSSSRSSRSGESGRGSRRRRKSGVSAVPELGSPLKIESKLEQCLAWFVDAGFIGLIGILPFVMGGRQAHGQLLLTIFTAWISLGWCLLQFSRKESRWIPSRVEWLLLLGVGLVFLQTMELPASLMQSFSPGSGQLLTTWQPDSTSPASLGVWNRISMIPYETLDGMVVLVCYVLIFVVAVQRLRSQRDVEKALVCVALSVTAMAVFALVQKFTSNGMFFWFYEHPFSSTDDVVKGGFTNRNHFAHFMALGIGPLFYWVATQANRKSKEGAFGSGNSMANVSAIAMISLATVAFALMLSLSRGGMIAASVAVTVCLFAAFVAKLLSGRIVGGLFGICVLLFGLLMVYGEQDVQERMTDLASASAEQLDASGGRRVIWTAVSRGIAEFPVFGSGIGSHREIYPTYLKEIPKFARHEFTHAENGYLQLCLESGSLGLGLALLGFLIVIVWCVTGMMKSKSSDVFLALAAGLAGILANLAHSVTDFVWYCPACVIIVIVLAACACRTRHMIRDVEVATVGWRMPKIAWLVAILGAGLLSSWMLNHKVPRIAAEQSWHDYMRLATNRLPDEDLTENEVFAAKMTALTKAAKADPQHARIQLRLGRGYLDLFQILQAESDNPMSLAQFREAALASNFESKEKLHEWLNRAIGDRLGYLEKALSHTRRALRLCPLQGQGYLSLSELAFLDMADAQARDDYVAQALQVRPYDPMILFSAGREALMAGRTEIALAHYKNAFNRNDVVRDKIIQMLAPSVPAKFMIDNFDPDVDALAIIAAHYRGLNNFPELTRILNVYAERSIELANDDELTAQVAIEHWMVAQRCYFELGNQVKVRFCLESAIEVDPGDYNPRLAYGHWLYSIKRYDEAAEHLIWCAKRRPSDVKITTLAEYVRKKSMQQTKSAAFEGPEFEIEGSPAMDSQPTQIATDPSQLNRY